jgi:hypothetical protein
VALALGHVIRIAIFAAISTVRPGQLDRVRAERAGLSVILGRSGPPLGPYSQSALAGGT